MSGGVPALTSSPNQTRVGELRIAKLGEGRHVLHLRPALGAGDAERLELAGGVLRRRGVDLREAEQRMAGDQAVGLQARAAIGHVGEIEIELLVEQEAQEMRRRAGRVGRVAELAAVLPWPRPGTPRRCWPARSDAPRTPAAPATPLMSGRKSSIFQRRLLNTLGLISVSAWVPTQIRWPSAGCIDHVLGRDVAGRAGPVLDDDGLAERLRHLVGDDAGVRVDGAAGRQSDDEADRAGLRRRAGAWEGERAAPRRRAAMRAR